MQGPQFFVLKNRGARRGYWCDSPLEARHWLPTYPPLKTDPFPHQTNILRQSMSRVGYAHFLEMGLGKSWIALSEAEDLYLFGVIDALLVVAPNGVAPNWTLDEIPTHLGLEASIHLWQTKKAATKRHKAAWSTTIASKGLKVLVMSYDALLTKAGTEAARGLLEAHRTFFVLDESDAIKTHNTQRTKLCLKLGPLAAYRRVMTGTPVSNSPFDVWAQLKFLDDSIWDPIGCRRYQSFKTYFGIWETHQLRDGRYYPTLVEYRNLDQLHEIVDRVGSRLLKDDVLDLPPKLYQKRRFELGKEQRRIYDTLRDAFLLWLEDDDLVTAPLAITRMLRLQQITSGYLPTDGGARLVVDPNPRLECFRETVEGIQGQFIAWGKFQADIDLMAQALWDMGIGVVTYDGRTSPEDREQARLDFRSGKARAFVSNPQCAGVGLTLTEAKTVVYYNNSYKLRDRLQSEDRAHRIGQDQSVLYIDIMAYDTIDEKIVDALVQKLEYASMVTGDVAKEWI